MDSQPSVLIISRSAQLRNSLKVLIQSSPLVKSIRMAEDVRSFEATHTAPALVFLAFGPDEKDVQASLRQVKTLWPDIPTAILLDSERQLPEGITPGVVLVKGVLAANLLRVIESLLH